MDHGPLWNDALGHESIEVPYICNAFFRHDELGLMSYPYCVEFDMTRLSEHNAMITKLRLSGAFLSTWLWFGLLDEAPGIRSLEITGPNLLNSAKCTKYISDRQFLIIQRLRACIQADLAMWTLSSNRQVQVLRVGSRVPDSRSFIASALSRFWRRMLTQYVKSQKSRDTMHILLTCQVLCETFVDSYDIEIEKSAGACVQEIRLLHIVELLLWRSVWCLRKIEEVPKIVPFSCFISLCQDKTRRSCFKQDKRPFCQIELSEQVPKHTVEHCSCIQLETPSLDIHIAYQENKITLCRFQKGGQISLVFQSFNDLGMDPYIAISHVRSSGLGNSAGNSLPLCQVALLQQLVDQVAKSYNMRPKMSFWIDTLCLPRKEDLRIATLTAARQIFNMAEAVLVLDPPLYKHSFSSNQEALTRIRYSHWKDRLWTLEEGSMARSLIFRFSHGMITLKELLRSTEGAPANALLNSMSSQIRTWRLAHNLSECQTLPCLVGRFADDFQTLRRSWQEIAETTHLDEQKLKRILRLGYLSSPVFRYFVQEDEYNGILAVQKTLVKVYGGPRFEDQKGPADENDLHHLVGRMMVMSSTQLPSEVIIS